tara:strand:+ start:51 stop:1301 length:1251 start_codon:yes stop_codon:yes gene_type:complete
MKKTVITFPTLSDKGRQESFEKTPKFNYWNTNKPQSRKVFLSDLVSQAEFFGKAQASRAKGLDPMVVAEINRSFYSGMQVNELMVVTKSPHSDKYIVIEGNNRHAASLKFCRENSLDESKAYIYALEVVMRHEYDFGHAIQSLGQQYNNTHLATVTNQPILDGIAWGKMAMKSKTISKNTSKEEIERLLVDVQGFKFGQKSQITLVVNAIKDESYEPSDYIRLSSGDASTIVSKLDFLGSKKSRVGKEIRALSPINPAFDTAIDNFALIKRNCFEPSVDKVVFTVWGSFPNLYDLHINRGVLFTKIYEEYKDTMKYAIGQHVETLDFNDFYKDLLSDVDSDGDPKFHVEFWMISQDIGKDETNPDFGSIETKHLGQPIFVNKLLAEDILQIIKQGSKSKTDRSKIKQNQKDKLRVA